MTPHELAAKTGEVIGVSEWLEVSQKRINTFAAATDDHQFIHVDPDKARHTPFGGTIAHGFLTLSLIPALGELTRGARPDNVKIGINYGGNKTRFIAPVRAGKRVRSHTRLLELVEKRPGQWQQTTEITIEIEGEDKPALVAEWITQFFV